MKKVVSFSGGRTSAYLCKLMIDKFGCENVDFVYMDTGAEHPKTYEFIRNVNKYFGLNLTCLRLKVNPILGKGNSFTIVNIDDCKPDLKPFKDMIEKYGVPYVGGMFCTDRMKLTPFKKYCNDTYGKGNYETWLGIRADEPNRYLGVKSVSALKDYSNEEYRQLLITLILNGNRVDGEFDIFNGMWCDTQQREFRDEKGDVEAVIQYEHNNKTKNNIHYMAEISSFEKEDILNWWKSQQFDLEIDEWNGNCLFCPKKSNLKLAASQRDNPGDYLNYIEMLHDDSVRIDDNTGNMNKMYRGNQSLENLIATFDGSTGNEIKSRIRGGHHIDTNSCSESCEVFNLS